MKARTELLADLALLLERILPKITDDSDMMWGWYETPALLRADLSTYVDQLNRGDLSSLAELNLLFLPTSVLQEHSIQNGWSTEYLELSKNFDTLYNGLSATS